MTTTQKYALLLSRFQQLENTFEALLVDQFVLCELRDFWRKRAGLETKTQDDAEEE